MPILQKSLPKFAWTDPKLARLPGVFPVEGGDWLTVDDAYSDQMAERDRLILECPERVIALEPDAEPAAHELFDMILDKLGGTPGYRVDAGEVQRPDGVVVILDRKQPLKTLGRLVQEDLCLMQKTGQEHVLTGAVLCFPASWSLQEKLGRPMIGIHRTVAHYTDDLAKRVQRLFDMIRPNQALWRMNALVYADPTLHQPKREDTPRTNRRGGDYVRSERQTLVRLPKTQAVLFAIHTYVVKVEDLELDAKNALLEARL